MYECTPNPESVELCSAWRLLQEAREATEPDDRDKWNVLERVLAETARKWYFSKPRGVEAQGRRDADRDVIDKAGIPVGPPHGYRPLYVQ